MEDGVENHIGARGWEECCERCDLDTPWLLGSGTHSSSESQDSHKSKPVSNIPTPAVEEVTWLHPELKSCWHLIVLLGRDSWWVAHAVVHDLNTFMGLVLPCPCRRQ